MNQKESGSSSDTKLNLNPKYTVGGWGGGGKRNPPYTNQNTIIISKGISSSILHIFSTLFNTGKVSARILCPVLVITL